MEAQKRVERWFANGGLAFAMRGGIDVLRFLEGVLDVNGGSTCNR